MEFDIRTGAAASQRTACAVIGVFEDNTLTAPAQAIDEASDNALQALIKRGDITGKSGSSLLLHDLTGVTAERVLVIGLGKAEKFNPQSFRNAIGMAIKIVANTGSRDTVLHLLALPELGQSCSWAAQQATYVAAEMLYIFDQFKSEKKSRPKLEKISFGVDNDATAREGKLGIAQGKAMADGAALTRDLANLPANICTPSYIAEQAKKLAHKYKLGLDVLDRKQMQALGMNTLLSVAAGSDEPPKLIVLRYMGGKAKAKPVILVGKGVTFDTGGISLKPGEGMDEMKYDMCGAASVLGTIKAIAALDLAINVIGIIPATENMPSGTATRPGDIVTSMSGQTVEILNTDAEGRLILCDALTYAERFDPECVIDIATLTGACIIALGHVASGLLANDDSLAQDLLAAGTVSGDRAWQLPLWEDYQDQLNSNFADMANIGGRPAGTITAASFLARFTKKYRWAHLDIAGTAWRSGKDKGATGRPVPLLTNYLISKAATKRTGSKIPRA